MITNAELDDLRSKRAELSKQQDSIHAALQLVDDEIVRVAIRDGVGIISHNKPDEDGWIALYTDCSTDPPSTVHLDSALFRT